jgi:amino acid adenylation domain-containing protein
VLLSRERLAQALPERPSTVLHLEKLEAELAAQPTQALEVEVAPANLAYLIYTSGSTGRPKGTLLTHRGLCNTAPATARRFGLGAGSRLLQFASPAFDASVWEVFSSLVAGACLVLAPRERMLPGDTLHALLREERITTVTLTPSVLALLEPEGLPELRTLVSGGEACPPEVARRWSRGGRTLLDAYGPTEVTICVTMSGAVDPEHLTIGRPLPDMEVYVLDGWGQPVPAGVPGELYVGGVGLARGYLERPELTAERFVPHPFSATPGARLYRTGDRVRWFSDGQLEYLGRVDFQVKLRGFRIELGEVESVLREHPAVGGCVVVVRQEAGDKRLVAYVVAREGQEVEGASLRAHLRPRLPEYMVPSALVVLEALPLTSSGKVDLKALPSPEGLSARSAEPFVAPRDALELQLARLWERLLGVEPVGVHSNFFELGGHSLLAVRLMSSLRELTGRGLPLAALFQAPTVELQARLLRQEAGPWSPLVRLEPGREGRRPFFCVHPAGGNTLAYAELSRLLGPEQPFYGLQARGAEEGQQPLGTVEEMAALYVEAIRSVQPEGPYLLGGWSLGGTLAYEMARQLRAHGEQVALLALLDTYAPGVVPAVPRSGGDEAAAARVVFARAAAQTFGVELGLGDEALARMGDDEVMDFLLEQGRRSGVTLAEAGRPHLNALRRVFESNLRAVERYVPGSFPGRVVLLAASEARLAPPTQGWASLASLEVEQVPGSHDSMLRMPHVRQVAERLRVHLERARAEAASVAPAGKSSSA